MANTGVLPLFISRLYCGNSSFDHETEFILRLFAWSTDKKFWRLLTNQSKYAWSNLSLKTA